MTSRPKNSSLPPEAQVLSLGAAPEDALRAMLQTLIQETLEREFTQFLGAAPFERSAARRGLRKWAAPPALSHARGPGGAARAARSRGALSTLALRPLSAQ